MGQSFSALGVQHLARDSAGLRATPIAVSKVDRAVYVEHEAAPGSIRLTVATTPVSTRCRQSGHAGRTYL